MNHVRALSVLLVLFLSDGRGQDILQPENIVTFGIPPVPALTSDAARRYTEFRSASFVSWHPTELAMLISTRFADVPQIHRVSAPGGMRTQLTFSSEPVSVASYQPTRGDYFLFSKDTGGSEWYQTYRYDLANGAVTLLTDGSSRNTPGVWSTKGDRIAYGSTRRNGRDMDFYLLDPVNPASNAMLLQLDQGEGWSILAWSPNDSTILALETVSANESALWLVDVSRHDKRLLTPNRPGQRVSYRGGLFSRDGSVVYTMSDADNEFHRLVSIDVRTGKQLQVSGPIPWDVEDFDLTKDGRLLAYLTNEDGVGTLRVLNTATGIEQTVSGLPIGVITGIRWHNDGAHLAFTLSSARTGTDVYVLTAGSGRIERWTTSETGGIPAESFAEPRLIHWKTFDGRLLSGFLYMPPSHFPGKRPVMVVIHGGPEGQSRPAFQARANFYLNELGVAVVYPNVRGSTGYGKRFLALDNGIHREDSYKDIASLLDWIKAQDQLDGERIMVTGTSYGGHATLAVAAFYGEKFRCAVDVVGMSNLVTFLEHTEAYRRDLRRAEYGDERDSTMRAYLQRIAPINNLGTFSRPMLVIGGKNDPRVPVSESEQIVAALKERKSPVWYLMASDEGHGFRKKRNIDYQFFVTIQFMKAYLLN